VTSLVPFDRAFRVVSDQGLRVAQRDYQTSGALPVVDQGAELVGGYTDRRELAVTTPGPLLVFGDHTRRVKYVDFEFAVGAQGVKLLEPRTGVGARYAFYALQALSLEDRGYGRHFALLRQTSIPLPPLDEQQRIVAILEDHLSRLDAAQANLASATKRLTSLRGARTASLLDRAAGQHGVATYTLGEVLAKQAHGGQIVQGWSPRCESRAASGATEWGVLKTTAIQDGAFLPGENKALPSSLEPRPELAVQPGDILLTRAGPRARCGVSCLVTASAERLMLSDKMYRLRVNEARMRQEFLALVLGSPHVRTTIDRMKTGINDSGVNLTQSRLLELRVPAPPLDRQDEVVQAAAFAAAGSLAMQRGVDRALPRLVGLRRALLAAALSGRLTGHSSDLDLAEEMAFT